MISYKSMFLRLWGNLRVILLILVVALAFVIGRWSVGLELSFPLPIFSGWQHMDGREDNFLATVKDWKTFMTKNDGFIPEDPYRGLLASSPDWTFNSLRDVYFAPYLPPRLNPDVSKNPRYVVFSYRPSFPNSDFNWEYYADGSWAKVPVAGRSVADAGSTDVDNWVHDFPKTGLPNCTRAGERDAWVANNKNQLRWDEKLKEYVVTTHPPD